MIDILRGNALAAHSSDILSSCVTVLRHPRTCTDCPLRGIIIIIIIIIIMIIIIIIIML